MNHELESAVESLLFRMNLSTKDERKEAFDILTGKFCEHCGQDLSQGYKSITGCFCQRDD